MLARCAVCLDPRRFAAGEGVGILTYHRVAPVDGWRTRPTWNVTPDVFERQLVGLIERGFQPLPLAALISALLRGHTLPRKSFVVTFDDGYQNNYDCAWPVLQRHQVPATIFLATRYVGSRHPFPFEDWQPVIRRGVDAGYWQPLTLDQCLRMRDSGLIDFGSHTHSHECFLGRPDEFRSDLEASLDYLDRELGIERPPFSFPFGCTSPEMVSVVESLSLTCAVTTREQSITGTDSRFDLGRFSVEHCDDSRTLIAKLDGRYGALLRTMHRCLAIGGRMQRTPPGGSRRQKRFGVLPAPAILRSTRP